MKLLFIAWLCVILCSLSVDARRRRKKKKKPEAVVPSQEVLCDTCQTVVWKLYEKVDPGMKSYPGAVAVRVNKALEEKQVCTFTDDEAGRLDLKKSDMESACKHMYTSLESSLEESLLPGTSETAVAEAACLTADICSSLWPEENHISQRESPAEKNERLGAEYLSENLKKEGVIETASGLQYEIVTKADPEDVLTPAPQDRVKVHYRGTLINGDEFDSSYSRDEPSTFGVGEVIAGWTEGLQLMSEGDTFRFAIPWELAYGERGSGSQIGPRSTLLFDVELIEIEVDETEFLEEEEDDDDEAATEDEDEEDEDFDDKEEL